MWEINQNLGDEELSKVISSTPNFKACGTDRDSNEILQGFDSPVKDDSEESSENNSNISSCFKCFKALINGIWNGDFPKKHGLTH